MRFTHARRNHGAGDSERAQRHGLPDKVTITSSSWALSGADLSRMSRGLVAEYARLDPLKVAASYGCEILR